uniref:Ribose-5-phosphate isomerase n=1 Tax=Metchnikovella dogieli TaxID=2804710 RepID=A0A896WBH2_9MICR|nr:ribose-5-phosphate isomerase [Metchnikovella dogieli]
MESIGNAAKKAVLANVTIETKTVGIGSGRTVPYILIELKKHLFQLGTLKTVKCIPSSFQTKQLIIQSDLFVGDIETETDIDVAFDGIDACDENLNAIKGNGCAMLKEKKILFCSKKNIGIFGEEKTINKMLPTYIGDTEKNINIEVLQNSLFHVMRRLQNILFHNGCTCILKQKDGMVCSFPMVTENGFFVIIWNPFRCEKHRDILMGDEKIEEVSSILKNIPGVVEHGLFHSLFSFFFVSYTDGSVIIFEKKLIGKEIKYN